MQTIIRCSGLPHYTDCPRKAAAKMLLAELVEDGYQLHALKTSVGAAVGTATHAAVETALMLRQEGKDYEKELEIIRIWASVQGLTSIIFMQNVNWSHDWKKEISKLLK